MRGGGGSGREREGMDRSGAGAAPYLLGHSSLSSASRRQRACIAPVFSVFS